MNWTQAEYDAHCQRQKATPAAQAAPDSTILAPAKGSKHRNRKTLYQGGGYDPFLALLAAHGLPAPETEYFFHPVRRFKADYAWPVQKLIVERQGGLWAKDKQGENNRAKRAHTLPLAILRDYEKSNLAQLAGWIYLQFTPEQLDKGLALETLRIILTERTEQRPAAPNR